MDSSQSEEAANTAGGRADARNPNLRVRVAAAAAVAAARAVCDVANNRWGTILPRTRCARERAP